MGSYTPEFTVYIYVTFMVKSWVKSNVNITIETWHDSTLCTPKGTMFRNPEKKGSIMAVKKPLS